MTEPFRIGIAGLGTVGTGVVQLVQDNAEILAQRAGRPIQITAVSARDQNKDRGVKLSGYEWVNSPDILCDHDAVDAVVEVIGGEEGAAMNVVRKSLSAGRDVVTANKALLAHHGYELAKLAEENNAGLAYEAAVAGGIPIIKAIREGYAANDMEAVYGILNGTCNYILTQMRETGRAFEDVLEEAQEKGYAEADPSFDVDGIDAGHKLCLLTSLAFGVQPDFKALRIVGIRDITAEDIVHANEMNHVIKLLGVARRVDGKVMQALEPCLVPKNSALGAVDGVFNAVEVKGNFVGPGLCYGLGAGSKPTASAIVADILDLARGIKTPAFGVPAASLKAPEWIDLGATKSGFYMRLNVVDRPGVIADVSAILRDHDVSIESFIQRSRDPNQLVDVVLMTHEARRSDIIDASKAIAALESVYEPPCLIRVEGAL